MNTLFQYKRYRVEYGLRSLLDENAPRTAITTNTTVAYIDGSESCQDYFIIVRVVGADSQLGPLGQQKQFTTPFSKYLFVSSIIALIFCVSYVTSYVFLSYKAMLT